MSDPITLAGVRAHIEQRIRERTKLAREQVLNSGVNADVCSELTEILALLDRAQQGGAP